MAKTFWLDDIALSVVGFVLTAVIAGILSLRFQRQPGTAVTLIVSMFFLVICSFVWALVGLWRSSRFYAGWRIWPVLARLVTAVWLGALSLFWIVLSQTLVTTYYNCTTGRDFGELAPFLEMGPCEILWYPKHGIVVRRLGRTHSGQAVVDPFE